jgi:hypothetical protein
VEPFSSGQLGHVTFVISFLTSLINFFESSTIFAIFAARLDDILSLSRRLPTYHKLAPKELFSWQARRDLNPQQPVLETGALPVELLAYTFPNQSDLLKNQHNTGELLNARIENERDRLNSGFPHKGIALTPFFVQGMFPVKSAVLCLFHPVGMQAFVLVFDVILALAFLAD